MAENKASLQSLQNLDWEKIILEIEKGDNLLQSIISNNSTRLKQQVCDKLVLKNETQIGTEVQKLYERRDSQRIDKYSSDSNTK